MFQPSAFIPILAVFLFLFPAFSFPGRGEQAGEEDQAGGKAAVACADHSEPFGPGSFAGEKKTLTVKGVDYAFRWCPPGDFLMGASNPAVVVRKNNPLHRVRLTQGFWILETEVTQKMWKSVMGTDVTVQREKAAEQDSEEEKDYYVLAGVGPNYPVYYVNWWEAVSFCRRLSFLSGQTVQLPTAAQWEYACRAGTQTDVYSGNIENFRRGDVPELDLIAWHCGNANVDYSGGEVNEGRDLSHEAGYTMVLRNGHLFGSHEVGGKEPNPWGLYDTIGNVREWCSDWANVREYLKYPYRSSVGWWKGWYSGPSYYHATDAIHTGFIVREEAPDVEDYYITVDPSGVPIDGGWGKFHRGGGWNAILLVDTAAGQDYDHPSFRSNDLGFRIVLIPEIVNGDGSDQIVSQAYSGMALRREGIDTPFLWFEWFDGGACIGLTPPRFESRGNYFPAARALIALTAQFYNERKIHQPAWVSQLLWLCGIEWCIW